MARSSSLSVPPLSYDMWQLICLHMRFIRHQSLLRRVEKQLAGLRIGVSHMSIYGIRCDASDIIKGVDTTVVLFMNLKCSIKRPLDLGLASALRILRIRKCSISDVIAAHTVRNASPHLKVLDLSSNPDVGLNTAKALSTYLITSQLEYLDISDSSMDDACMIHIAYPFHFDISCVELGLRRLRSLLKHGLSPLGIALTRSNRSLCLRIDITGCPPAICTDWLGRARTALPDLSIRFANSSSFRRIALREPKREPFAEYPNATTTSELLVPLGLPELLPELPPPLYLAEGKGGGGEGEEDEEK